MDVSENNSQAPVPVYRQILYMFLPVLLLFGVLEAGARIYESFHPPLRVDIGQGFGQDSLLFTPASDGFLETHPDKRVSFQLQRFKMPKPDGTLRIFALGGSSVNYLDYEFKQLEKNLREQLSDRYAAVEIINCGGLSYGSHRLVMIASEILDYAPDLVMLYSGHNEFEELQQMKLALNSYGAAQRVLGKTALYRVIRDTRARRRIAALEEAREVRALATTIPDSSKTWMHVFSPAEMNERMTAYRNNLAAIIRRCRDARVPLVIGSVPSNLFKPNLPGADGARYEEVIRLFNSGDYAEGARLGREILKNASPRHQSSDVENGIIRDLAKEYEVPLADVEAAVIAAEPHGVPGETLFNDHCHLNPEGNRILRETYQALIIDLVRRGHAP